MSDLNARLIVKASATTGEAPAPADLEVAELAINTFDQKIFTKHTNGNVVELASGGGSSVANTTDLNDVGLYETAVSDGPWSTGGSAANTPGHWRDFADSTNRLIFFNYSQDDGTDVSAPYLALVDGDSITFSGDGVTYHTFTLEGDATDNSGEVMIKTVEDPSIVDTFTTLYVAAGTTDIAPVEGDVLRYDSSHQQYRPAQPAGAGPLSGLTDVTTNAPGLGDILYKDNGGHKYLSASELLAGRATVMSAISAVVTTDTGLAGTNGLYADSTALINDGFTHISSGNDIDDSVILVPTTTGAWDSDFDSIDYVGRTISGAAALKINSNGAAYLDTANIHNYTGRTGNFGNDHPSADLCIAWGSQDMKTRRCGYKRVTQDGTTWFVLRIDFAIPYSSQTEGLPAEVWFGQDGRIRQYFGTFVGASSSLLVGATKQGISETGTILTNVITLTDAGGEMIAYGSPSAVLGFEGAKLEDLSDVGTPANDYILIYDDTTSSWVPEPIAPVATTNDYNDLINTPAASISLATLKTEVAASTDFADFQSRIAAL